MSNLTAEEYLNTECREFGGHDFLYIEKVREYARLYHQEKLREAEMSDVSDEEILNEAEDSLSDGVQSGIVRGAKWMRSKLSPKIAALKAELNYYKNILYSSSPESMKSIAQLQAEKEKLSRTIRIARGTLGYGDLDTEPETIVQVRAILDSALASLPEEGKTND